MPQITLTTHNSQEALALTFENPQGITHSITIPTSNRYALASLLSVLRENAKSPRAKLGTSGAPTQALLDAMLSDKKPSREALSTVLKKDLF